MEDIFYLSKVPMSADDIVEACKAVGVSRVNVFPDGVQAYYEEGQVWNWQFMSEGLGDLEGFEDRQRQKLRELEIITIAMVSYHHSSLGRLILILRLLMTKRGGCVATDDAAVEVLHDADTLGSLVNALGHQ